MKVSIASDHAGFAQKQVLVDSLYEAGHSVCDRGTHNEESVDYPDFALPVAHDVAKGEADRGILICGTGIGMAMTADKVAGIRAANCITAEFARLAREHNDANILTLSGRFVDVEENLHIINEFLSTPFDEGRHAARVEKIEKR